MHAEICGNNGGNNLRDIQIVNPFTEPSLPIRNQFSVIPTGEKKKKEREIWKAGHLPPRRVLGRIIPSYLSCRRTILYTLSRVSDLETSVPRHTEISGIIPRTALEVGRPPRCSSARPWDNIPLRHRRSPRAAAAAAAPAANYYLLGSCQAKKTTYVTR